MDVVQLPMSFAGEVIVIHCFFRSCAHVTQSANPQEAHDLMERHYTDKHTRQIERIVGPMKKE
jgi:hypothetical protein